MLKRLALSTLLITCTYAATAAHTHALENPTKPAIKTDQLDALPALRAWSQRCRYQRPDYPKACQAYKAHPPLSSEEAYQFLHKYWIPTQPAPMRLTGYYTPTYQASYQKTDTYDAPIYVPPPNKPSCTRAEINHHNCPEHAPILAWVNRIDRFFMQIEGSAFLHFSDGELRQAVYAGRNSFPYISIGKWMLKTHKITGQVSMQTIRRYLTEHPDEVDNILNKNSSFVYMKWRYPPRVIGASGFGLLPLHSVAVDTKKLPYGTLIELSEVPGIQAHLLTVADDRGVAIKGNHLDLYCGQSEEAAQTAGHLNHIIESVIWLPRYSN